MALNPSIILSQNAFDPTGAMDRGAMAAGRQNALTRQTGYDQAVTQYGAQAIGGDATAQNALAAYDPAMVQGLQSNSLGMQSQQLGMAQTRQNMDIQREELAMRREQARLQTQQQLAEQQGAIDMAAAAEDAAKLRKVLVGAAPLHAEGNEAQYNLFLQQNGIDPREYPMSEFPMNAATMEGVLDAIEGQSALVNGPSQEPEADRYQPVGGQIWDMRPEGGGPPTLVGGGTQETVYGPDGQPIVTRGPAGSARPFTEAQSKDVVFATRAQGALDVLDPIAPKLTERLDIAAGYVPFGLGKGAQDPDYQVARQAADEFLQAILRKDTGAAITEQEQALYGVTYLPQPGEGPEVLQAKADARRRAVAAIEAGMSASQIVAQEKALAGTRTDTPLPGAGVGLAERSPAQPAIPPFAAANGVTPEEWADMTDEEKRVWQQ